MTKAQKKAPKVKHRNFTEKFFTPYAISIGRLTLAWNDFHEHLASLFWTLIGIGSEDIPLGLWNSVEFDRPKRKLLRVLLEATTPLKRHQFPKMFDDITWILNKAEVLEDMRNNAVHAPLTEVGNPLLTGILYGKERVVLPNRILGNNRAKKLAQKDILQEFRLCRKTASMLRDFTFAVERALSVGPNHAWPGRPSLPTLRARKTHRRAQRHPRSK